jgi:hypothetical protein
VHSCLVYVPFNIHQHSKSCLKNLKRRVGILPIAFPTAARSCFLQLLWSHYTQRDILLELFFHQLLRTTTVLLQECSWKAPEEITGYRSYLPSHVTWGLPFMSHTPKKHRNVYTWIWWWHHCTKRKVGETNTW